MKNLHGSKTASELSASTASEAECTGVEGIEPPLRVLETPVIPLDQTPMNHSPNLYTILSGECQMIFSKNFKMRQQTARMPHYEMTCCLLQDRLDRLPHVAHADKTDALDLPDLLFTYLREYHRIESQPRL